jgi:hypothetical protein
MKRFSTSAFCPIVVDTPVQQDQDATNAARMISFCLSEIPEGSQLILGTVSLHGVKYNGHVIETDTKNIGPFETCNLQLARTSELVET